MVKLRARSPAGRAAPGAKRGTSQRAANEHEGGFEEFGGGSAQEGDDEEGADDAQNEAGAEYQEKVDDAGSEGGH